MVFAGYFKVSGQVVHTIENRYGSVTGIAVLNDRLYVGSTRQIAVYCPTTFQYLEDLSFNCPNCRRQCRAFQCEYCGYTIGYGGGWIQMGLTSLVGCGFNNCLYASERNNSLIYKVAFGQNNTVSFWSVHSHPNGLSVTGSHNLLVAMTGNNSLNEYSTDGGMIRQISLQAVGISNPVCTVQLSDNHYGVTHHGPAHQFSVISSDGQLVQSYRGDAGNMNEPRGIAVDGRGKVFVADQNNNRILVIDRKTLSAYQLRLPDDCALNGPYSIHLDSVNRRLYIGEHGGGRVICCKI